jgi:hypothetical protein
MGAMLDVAVRPEAFRSDIVAFVEKGVEGLSTSALFCSGDVVVMSFSIR